MSSCDFSNPERQCQRCGFIAECESHFRECLTLAETAAAFVEYQRTHRISIPFANLGDTVAAALGAFGVTSERLSAILGRDCGCDGRRQALNAASAAVSAGVERAMNSAAAFFFPLAESDEEVNAAIRELIADPRVNDGLKSWPKP